MTDQPQYPQYPGDDGQGAQPTPPPPAWGQAPPPPPYGQAPPPGYGQAPGHYPPAPGYGQPPQGFGPPAYAGWGSRLGAYLLDGLIGAGIAIVFFIAGGIVLGATGTASTDYYGNTTIDDANPLGYVLIGVGYVVLIAFVIWNFVFRQGRTGQTLGKKIVGIKVVKEQTGQPMGAGLALGRYLLFAIFTPFTCYINALWPLWDDKKQALHDKVVSTIVVTAS